MTPVLSLPSFTGNRNNIDIFLYNWRALWWLVVASASPGRTKKRQVRYRLSELGLERLAYFILMWKFIFRFPYDKPFNHDDSPNKRTLTFFVPFSHLPQNLGARRRIHRRDIKLAPYGTPKLFVTYPEPFIRGFWELISPKNDAICQSKTYVWW